MNDYEGKLDAKKLKIEDKLVKDYNNLINDKEIDVIIELIGGYEPAKTIILKALQNKKHVVTANKAVIAKHGNELFEAAKEKMPSLLRIILTRLKKSLE